MPTTTSITELDSQISSKRKEARSVYKRLRESPTALGGAGIPTSSDLRNQQEFETIQKSIQSLTNEKLRAKWYPPKDVTAKTPSAGEAGVSPGFIGSVIDFINRPIYGMVGATKHILGQTDGSLSEDIVDNMLRNKKFFGDVLKTAGVPSIISAPLGFALDVTMDPISWATMGTSALVPRLAIGAVKGTAKGGVAGGVRGLALGGKTSALQTATTIGKLTPRFRKTQAFKDLASKSIGSAEEFQKLTGTAIQDLVLKGGLGVGSYRFGLNDALERFAKAAPGGEKIMEHLKYDPHGWIQRTMIKDSLVDMFGAGSGGRYIARRLWAGSKKGEDLEPIVKELKSEAKAAREVGGAQYAREAEMIPAPRVDFSVKWEEPTKGILPGTNWDDGVGKLKGIGMDERVADMAPDITKTIDDAISVANNPDIFNTLDEFERAARLAGEKFDPFAGVARIAGEKVGRPVTLEEIGKIVESGALGETGVKWFDNMIRGIRTTERLKFTKGDKIYHVGKEVMDKYDQSMGIFRLAKVALSPTAWMNAVVGNTIMNHMALGDLSPAFFARLKDAWDMYRNKPGAAARIEGFMMNADYDAIRLFLETNKTAARGTFGTIDFLGAKHFAEQMVRTARDLGYISSKVKFIDKLDEAEDVLAQLALLREDQLAKIASAVGENVGLKGQEIVGSKIRGAEGGLPRMLKEGGKISRDEAGTSMLGQELMSADAARRMFKMISDKASKNPNNVTWKTLDFMFNRMAAGYQNIDESFKLATFIRAVKDGYTFDQIRKIRNLVQLDPEDLVAITRKEAVKGGEMRWKLPPDKALELVNVMYLNYAAMPSAIRILRNFPLLGSPFASFMYGMAIKTGQTIAYNPAAFTKVNFALKEFSGDKSPLEKKALEGEYYSYLNREAMFRLPFFEKNPAYLNLANMIPYYSFNMFNPSEANFNSKALPAKLVERIQKSPLFKDPIGGVLFDYVIQPLILSEATAPQGQFGQALYPINSGAMTKGLYGLRTLGEAYVPNILSYAGLVTPESIADYIPSYRWRSLAYSKGGKNQLGIMGKESATSRMLRNLFSTSGIPIQSPVDLSFVRRESKNK